MSEIDLKQEKEKNAVQLYLRYGLRVFWWLSKNFRITHDLY